MPTYEYECKTCGKVFDVFHGMSETGPDTCLDEGCGGDLIKLISAGSGLIFKGSGFYITDYKNKGRKGDEGGGEGKSESKDKGDSKTAKKDSASKSDSASSSSSSESSSSSGKSKGSGGGGAKE